MKNESRKERTKSSEVPHPQIVREAWINRSYALHELKRPGAAFDNLLPAAKKFPKVWLIPYNLACYCGQTGRLEESVAWLKKAMAIDSDTVKQAALDDPDLRPLWDSLGGSLWKKVE